MRRSSSAFVLTALLTIVAAGPAAAHSGVMPSRIPPGTTTEAELILAHGCGPGGTIPGSDDDALGTTLVTLQVPEDIAIEPRALEGWELTTQRSADGRVTEARWAYDGPDGTLEPVRFAMDLSVANVTEGTALWIPVVQDCVGGERLAWTHPGTDEVDGAYPASLLTAASPAGAEAADPAGGVSTVIIATLVIALAIAAGTGAYLVTGRRR